MFPTTKEYVLLYFPRYSKKEYLLDIVQEIDV